MHNVSPMIFYAIFTDSTDDPSTTTTVKQACAISMTTTEAQSGDICKHVVS